MHQVRGTLLEVHVIIIAITYEPGSEISDNGNPCFDNFTNIFTKFRINYEQNLEFRFAMKTKQEEEAEQIQDTEVPRRYNTENIN